MIKTRFAPSPTGLLHVGNIRTALVNYLFARKNGGEFILRIDDTDPERSKDEYRLQAQTDLKWLGLNWDSSFRQIDRLEHYNKIKQQLIEKGLLYPCYETPEELETKRKFMLKRGVPPIYDRAALKLSLKQMADYEAQGRKPHYRFKLEHKPIQWHDLVRGQLNFDGKNLTDPILFRADGSPTYIICSVIDDAEYGITHILRGEDHISNTAIQAQMFELMGYKVPVFAHLSLIKTMDGELSKRTGGFDIKGLRTDGYEAEPILSLLGKLGTSDAVDIKTVDELVDEFDLSKFGHSTANFMPDELDRLNQKLIHNMSFDEATAKGANNISADFWNKVKGNLNKLSEVTEWAEICSAGLKPIIADEDAEFIKQSAEHLPEQLDENAFKIWTIKLKEATGRKGKQLFMPIRLALTARQDGPELAKILQLISHAEILRRLNG